MPETVQRLLARLAAPAPQPGDAAAGAGAIPQVFLVVGDLVLAEPGAAQIADALVRRHGAQLEEHRRPLSLSPLLQDLRTYSLFGGGKVALVVDAAVFADRAAAADLIDDAEDALPLPPGAGSGSGSGSAKAGGSDGAAGFEDPGDSADSAASMASAASAASDSSAGPGRAGRPGKSGGGAAAKGSAAAVSRPLSTRERQAASRLMQALRLFEVEPGARPSEAVLDELPAWVFEGGRAARRGRGGRARGKRQVEELREGLVTLLDAARREGIEGSSDSDLSDLASLISQGLPPGHALVFAEREAAADHPLVRLLAERGALASVGEVEAGRSGWDGLELLVAELSEQTGVGIAGEALAELARRTLRKPSGFGGAGGGGARGGDGGHGSVTADSTARFAGEYRKLANLVRTAADGARAARIERRQVEEAVEDRGEEDVFKLLDAIGAGQGGEAMDRLRRLLAAADDPMAARLSFFALLATFCRRLTAIRGMMRAARVPGGEANYNRFAARLAPALQGELTGAKNPLAGVNPYALHRAYLAASRMPESLLARLPWDVLETELRLKGDSDEADTALARLVTHLAAAAAPKPAPRRPLSSTKSPSSPSR